jgi:DUF1365 family protein
MLAEAGIDIAGGAIRLLCLPRMLGYVFNPLSLYYCHRPDGALAAVLLEVNNTFGERHVYLVEAEPNADGRVARRCAKSFFVSPFLGLDMTYDFRLAAPGERAATAIVGRDPEGAPIIAAAFVGHRRDLSDAELARAFFAHPLLTLKVIIAIHFEALKLVLKGVGLRRKPAPPRQAITLARSEAHAPVAHEADAQGGPGQVARPGSRGGLEAQEPERAEVAVGEQPQVDFAA